MRTRAIQPGDVVKVDKRGRVFYALVVECLTSGGLRVEPLDRRVSWRRATAREVVDHWAHARADRSERPPAAQLSLSAADEPGHV